MNYDPQNCNNIKHEINKAQINIKVKREGNFIEVRRTNDKIIPMGRVFFFFFLSGQMRSSEEGSLFFLTAWASQLNHIHPHCIQEKHIVRFPYRKHVVSSLSKTRCNL